MNLAGVLFSPRVSGAGDYSLLADSFKKNIAKEYGGAGQKRWKVAEEQRALFDRILLLPETRCLVMASKESPRHVGGWVCFTPAGPDIVAIHYAYVKWGYRPIRLADELLELTGVEGKRLIWTFDGRLAQKLSQRLLEKGFVTSAGYVPAADFLADMGEIHDGNQSQQI